VEASPTGAGLVTDTLPAGKSPRGPGLASLPGWDDRIPRNAKIRVALSAFAPLPRLRPFPPSSPLFQCRKGAGFCQRPESGRQSARGGQLASHQLLQYSELHGWGWRRNGKRQCASGGAPPRCVAGLEKLRGSKRATMAVAVDSP
jgi:hypothetical protein